MIPGYSWIYVAGKGTAMPQAANGYDREYTGSR